MSVGLIDQDCLNNKKDFFFDLDIMKLASYYKSKKEITKLLLDPREYTQYTKTYFIKNRFDYRMFLNLFKDNRIIYRGYAFSSNEYEPLPEDIEKARADTTIYHTYLKYNENIAERRKEGTIMAPLIEKGCHSRLSKNNQDCNTPIEQILYKPTEILFLYDYNIFALKDWYEATEPYRDKTLGLRFPPITNNINDIEKILTEYKLRSENHIILSGDINTDQLEEIVSLGKLYKDHIRVHILQDLNPFDEDIYKKQIYNAMNTVLRLKKDHTRIHAYIDARDINPKTSFLNNIQYWCDRNHNDSSFYEYIHFIRKRCEDKFDKLAAEDEIFNYLYRVIPSKWEKIC